MKTSFFLARHGETEWNVQQKLQGQLDSSLTDKGIQQATKLARILSRAHTIDLIVTSPLRRAVATANLCQQTLNIELETHPALMERHFGQWQEKPLTELHTHPDYHSVFHQVNTQSAPLGESGIACATRFEQGLTDIANRHPNKTILIISHGDAIRCFSSLKLEVNATTLLDNTGVYHLTFHHNQQTFQLHDRLYTQEDNKADA
ncbi:histidine phosphatase family protein [Vibrio sp. Of7-15]|uniref:histidine phosphatase family protein n=1 Tax=Vibrio sp. Of7-15 TaxID=2724879 RepID=UPI001EF27A2B|nr:histidine phosphatase family protein [Vibrio sp. Of7-15]MCG7499324.1 histidine phosphatase family protein [Vibrio sp. Of7-15]